jgi:simple sugar transport system substrate-binding protein
VRVDPAGLLRQLAAPDAFPRHPAWKFAFLSHLTTDPLYVALQYGIQDGVALVGCSSTWGGSARGDADELAKALDTAIDTGVDGIACPALAAEPVADAIARATAARIPVVALGSRAPGAARVPLVGVRAQRVAAAIAARVAAAIPSGPVAVFAGDRELVALGPVADAVLEGLGRRRRLVATLVPTGEDVYAQVEAVAEYAAGHADLRALVALDTGSTEGLSRALEKLGSRADRVLAAGWGVLPATLKLVAAGRLAFTIDEEPYQQGFLAAVQLFLARVSGGLLAPSDVHTGPIVVTKQNLARYLNTKTRFEGSSSRQRYPIG